MQRGGLPTQPLQIYIGTWRMIKTLLHEAHNLYDHRMDTPSSWPRFASKQDSRWRYMPSITAIRPHLMRPWFEPQTGKPTYSNVDMCPASTKFWCPARAAYSSLPSSSFLTWPTPSTSPSYPPCILVLMVHHTDRPWLRPDSLNPSAPSPH